MRIIIIISVFLITACSSDTKLKKKDENPKVKIHIPNFNADSAYHYIQKQVDLFFCEFFRS